MFRVGANDQPLLDSAKIEREIMQDRLGETVINIDPEQGLPIWKVRRLTLVERSVSECASLSLRAAAPLATDQPFPRLDKPALSSSDAHSVVFQSPSTDELIQKSLHKLGLSVDDSIQNTFNEHRNSIAMHLSLASTLSESGHHALAPVNPAANSCWPLRWLGSIVSRWARSLTPDQRQTWIGRIRTFEHTLHNAIRKQIVFNGYKYTIKVMCFLLQMQMPEAMQLGFQMADINNRFDSLQVWRI